MWLPTIFINNLTTYIPITFLLFFFFNVSQLKNNIKTNVCFKNKIEKQKHKCMGYNN